jgi:hypothetical protein
MHTAGGDPGVQTKVTGGGTECVSVVCVCIVLYWAGCDEVKGRHVPVLTYYRRTPCGRVSMPCC